VAGEARPVSATHQDTGGGTRGIRRGGMMRGRPGLGAGGSGLEEALEGLMLQRHVAQRPRRLGRKARPPRPLPLPQAWR